MTSFYSSLARFFLHGVLLGAEAGLPAALLVVAGHWLLHPLYDPYLSKEMQALAVTTIQILLSFYFAYRQAKKREREAVANSVQVAPLSSAATNKED